MSDVRSEEPDRALPGQVVVYEQVFRDAAPTLWRTIYAFTADWPGGWCTR